MHRPGRIWRGGLCKGVCWCTRAELGPRTLVQQQLQEMRTGTRTRRASRHTRFVFIEAGARRGCLP